MRGVDGGRLKLNPLPVFAGASGLSAFRLSARSAPIIEYVFKEGEDRTRAAESWARSSLTMDARKQLAQALLERTGGTFVFDP